MVESPRRNRSFFHEATLHLIGDGERGQKLLAGSIAVFSRGQERAKIVRRVAGLTFGEKVVHEIEVAHQRRVEERGPIRSGLAAADAGRTSAWTVLLAVALTG